MTKETDNQMKYWQNYCIQVEKKKKNQFQSKLLYSGREEEEESVSKQTIVFR